MSKLTEEDAQEIIKDYIKDYIKGIEIEANELVRDRMFKFLVNAGAVDLVIYTWNRCFNAGVRDGD